MICSRVLVVISCLLVSFGSNAEMRDLPNITVLSESSLTAPLTEITRIYSRKNNITVTASFNSSSEQAWRIEEGEPADIFISSHPFWMTELKQMGLINVYSLTNLVKNKLVLTTSTKGRFNEYPIPGIGLDSKLQFLANRTIMAFGDPLNTGLGIYTKQALQTLDKIKGTDLWKSIGMKTIKSPTAKNCLYLIAHGETAGIAYYSDAYNNEEVRVLTIIDEDLHEPIVYQAAVVAGENMKNAEEFMEFLESDISKTILKKHGFITD